MVHISRLFFIAALFLLAACNQPPMTHVSIHGEQFLINNKPTYQGRYWQGHKVEGLLMNARLVQGIFDDSNPETVNNFKYPDTGIWDPERNTNEFIAAMPSWKKHGLLSFTLNLQGGSPLGYGNKGWVNTAFHADGSLKSAYLNRLEKILDRANELEMVVILGYFYGGQDQHLKNEEAVYAACDNMTNWILEKGYQNILVEINNECDYPVWDHDILWTDRVHELVKHVQQIEKDGHRLLVSTSYRGGAIPSKEVIQCADFLLIHGNKVEEPYKITIMVDSIRNTPEYKPMPIVFNEDDHYDFEQDENNMTNAVKAYASWGYFDFRMKDEGFENGFQSVPVDWKISSDRKQAFFNKLKEITGTDD